MDRRVFLSGVFGGITSAGLILAAKPEEVAAFASPLIRDQPLVMNLPAPGLSSIGDALYNVDGQLVAYLESIDVDRERVGVNLFGDSQQAYVPGLATVRIQAVGIRPLVWNGVRYRL